jgi:hypothetical protein
MIAVALLLRQGREDRTASTGQLDRIAVAGQPGHDSVERTAQKGQPEDTLA